ncbi:MAG: hypothetical protein ABL921_02640 [Pirellula sp.]
MDVETLLQRLLLPFVGSFVGCFLLASTDPGEEFYDDEPIAAMAVRTIFGALICSLSMIASDLWGRGLIATPNEWGTWKAGYQWEWMVWAIPSCILIMALARSFFTVPNHHVAVASSLTACLAVGTLFVCLNEGDIWKDLSSKLMPWFALALVAIALNVFALNSIASTGGSRWSPLVVLGQFGCVAVLTLQSYGSLGNWCLVGASVCLGASAVGLVKGSYAKLHFGWPMSVVMIPMLIMSVANLVVSRFFESPEVPDWLLACILFLPTIGGVVDLLLGRLGNNPWVRVVIAAVTCSSVVGAVWYFAPLFEKIW